METENLSNIKTIFLDSPCRSPIPAFLFSCQVSPVYTPKVQMTGVVRDINGRHVCSIHQENILLPDHELYDAIIVA